MKIEKLPVAFAFVLIALVSSCFAQTLTETLQIAGLKESVTVRRDERSIPYIEAKNDADLYFAQGFVTAQDRLWQMDLYRRVARGETAEIFGKATLEDDKRWRKFGFAKIADESFALFTPELKAVLENYARGVNAYIATLDDKTLPVEFRILQYKPRQWTTSDTLVIGKILADGLSTTWRNDLIRASLEKAISKEKFDDLNRQVTPYDVVLFGKDSKPLISDSKFQIPNFNSENALAFAENEARIRRNSLERIGFYAEDLAASNNWVISGKRTADGKPLLANDPHLPGTAPGIWYLSHLSSPDSRVSGVTFPGVPGIVLGHNEFIAWGATNVGPDVQDIYFETFNEKGEYKTPSGWKLPTVRKEEIKVRANPIKPDTETVFLDVQTTRNGVIIGEEGGKKFALRWTALDAKNQDLEAFFRLNRAKNWDDFKTALKSYGGATQNFVYADVKGNIGWYAAGKVPTRKTSDGAVPYDGATDNGAWTGYIPFEELPNLYNPAEGFIVTANQRIVGTDYKYPQMSRDAAMPWRALRIYDSLKNNQKVTMDAVRDVMYDSLNLPVSSLAKEIVKLNAASPETLEVLKTWNGKMTADSKGAVLANEIRNCLANKIADDNKPVPSYMIRERILWWAIEQKSAKWLPKQFADYPTFLKTCDTEARTSLSDPKRAGADSSKWTWGNVFKSRFSHPLAEVAFIGAQFVTPNVGIDGSGQTPNVGSSVSMRHIASPGNWDATRHVIPLGQSGNPQSPFYKDQFEAWRTGTPAIFPFTKTAVEKAAKEVILMTAK